MKIIFSASIKPYKDKGYFQGFKPKQADSLDSLAKFMQNYALCSHMFTRDKVANKGGKFPARYRKTTDAVIGTGNIILLDVDNGDTLDKNKQCHSPVTYKQIKKAIKRMGWCAVIIESKSSRKAWRKYHIAIPTSQPLPSYKTHRDKYRKIYAMVAHELNIRCDKAMQSGIQNMTPSLGRDKYKIIEGKFISTQTLKNKAERGFAPRPIPKGSKTVKNDSGRASGWDFATLHSSSFVEMSGKKVGDRVSCPNSEVSHSKNGGKGYGFINDYEGITCNGCCLNYCKPAQLAGIRLKVKR